MKSLKIILLLFLPLLLINCKNSNKKGFLLTGKIKGDFKDYIYLKYNNTVDSVLVKNNQFNFKGIVLEPTRASLFPESPYSKKMMGLTSFILENSNISVFLKYSEGDFRGKKTRFLDKDSIIGSKIEDLDNSYKSLINNTINSKINDSLKEATLYKNLYKLISENPRLKISASQLSSFVNFYDYLSSTQINTLVSLLDTSYQNKNDLNAIERASKRRQILKKGNIPPRILLPNQKGVLFNSNSIKNKYTLIEFWASWCIPCRQTNPQLVNIYETYKNRGFNIIGVSIDTDIEKWQKAIKKDKLEWTQVIDTLNKVGETYYLTGVPYNFLLDKNGKVIARNIKPYKLKPLLAKLTE